MGGLGKDGQMGSWSWKMVGSGGLGRLESGRDVARTIRVVLGRGGPDVGLERWWRSGRCTAGWISAIIKLSGESEGDPISVRSWKMVEIREVSEDAVRCAGKVEIECRGNVSGSLEGSGSIMREDGGIKRGRVDRVSAKRVGIGGAERNGCRGLDQVWVSEIWGSFVIWEGRTVVSLEEMVEIDCVPKWWRSGGVGEVEIRSRCQASGGLGKGFRIRCGLRNGGNQGRCREGEIVRCRNYEAVLGKMVEIGLVLKDDGIRVGVQEGWRSMRCRGRAGGMGASVEGIVGESGTGVKSVCEQKMVRIRFGEPRRVRIRCDYRKTIPSAGKGFEIGVVLEIWWRIRVECQEKGGISAG
ncbi:hypothetical protein AAG906_027910 [Vitis piasezkii]